MGGLMWPHYPPIGQSLSTWNKFVSLAWAVTDRGEHSGRGSFSFITKSFFCLLQPMVLHESRSFIMIVISWHLKQYNDCKEQDRLSCNVCKWYAEFFLTDPHLHGPTPERCWKYLAFHGKNTVTTTTKPWKLMSKEHRHIILCCCMVHHLKVVVHFNIFSCCAEKSTAMKDRGQTLL